tara:strand:+ start:172 stop:627 length:456 start_codon:yes stop_codon:yes gene_type:complete
MLNLITGLLPVAEKVLDKILPDPEAKAKAVLELQKLEQSGELKKIEVEFQNVDSAREREMKIANSQFAPMVNKIIVPCLAILIVFLTFGMMSAILFMDIESGKNYEISLYILGLLSGALMSCINYYFGSSTGSKEKSKELQDMFSKKEPKL